ncbi:CHAT domain-containing protein [Arthrobacter sp. E3]|uniref:CHAT domain-containing protein n=1 Tax=Arthrobacter sp. E3 TaxID=517402 RepID=UPI001A93FD05
MSVPGALPAADAAYQAARTAVARYDLAEVRKQLDEAGRQLEGLEGRVAEELRLRLRLTGAWLRCDEQGLAAGLETIDVVLAEAAARGSADTCALAHLQAGVLLARSGEFDVALGRMRAAVKLSAALSVDEQIRLLINKGTIGSRTSSLAEAAADLQAAADLATDLPVYRFIAMHNRGFVEYLRGDLPEALRIMAEADALDVDVERSVAWHDRARVLLEAGLVEEAGGLLEQAVEGLHTAGLFQEWSEARLDQARWAVLSGQPARGVAIAHDVVVDSVRRGEDARAQGAELVALEARLPGTGTADAELAAAAGDLASRTRAAGRPWLADRAIAVQVIAAGTVGGTTPGGETVRALRRLRESSYLATRIMGISAQLSIAGSPAHRNKLMREAAALTAAARAGVSSLDLRTAVAIHLQPIVRADLERVAADGHGWAALQATERWRAALQGFPSVIPPAKVEIAGLWSSLRRLHEELRTGVPGAAPQTRTAIGVIELQLREHYWASQKQGPALPAQRLTRSFVGDAGVMDYFWAGDFLHAVRLAPGRPAQLLRLGTRQEVTDLLSRVTADAQAGAQAPAGRLEATILSSLAESLERLEEMVLPDAPGSGPLVVVPSGALARLPWAMLPSLRGRGVVVSRSLRSWRAGATVLGRAPRVAVAAGPGLALAEKECAGVAAHWAAVRTIPADQGAVIRALATYDVVHIAAHGRHREDSPLFSSLRLHGGLLFAHELEQVPIRSSLVVLSACGVGLGRLRPGDEALGLTSSLLAMGVGAVVAPLTDVPDTTASRVMAELHRRLAAGQDGPAALAAACDSPLDASFTWFGSPWCAPRLE